MSFYEQIAPYYDQIFPAGQEQLEFIKNSAGSPPKRLLDIACGAGLYSTALAYTGYEIWATDLDAEMVRQTKIRAAAQGVTVNVQMLDMLGLDRLRSDVLEPDKLESEAFRMNKSESGRHCSGKSIKDQFDCVFCIGNSIVHLGSRDTIFSAVVQMKKKLKETGTLILQIINFDRVIAKGITALPSVINPESGLEFQRNYSFDTKTGLIGFDTLLEINKNSSIVKYSNSIKLFPLFSTELRDILERAGFKTIEFFGDFKMEPYVEEESYLLVAKASI